MSLTKGRAKELALRWLDEATLNGQTAGAELTADYTDKFNYFLYPAMVYMSNIFRLRGTKIFDINKDSAENVGNFIRLYMPEDFMELKSLVCFNNEVSLEIPDYQRETTLVYLIPKAYISDNVKIEAIYWRYPKKIENDASDGEILDLMPKAEILLPLRLAVDATAGSDETNAISAYLEGKFSSMVQNLIGEDENYANGGIERVYFI